MKVIGFWHDGHFCVVLFSWIAHLRQSTWFMAQIIVGTF